MNPTLLTLFLLFATTSWSKPLTIKLYIQDGITFQPVGTISATIKTAESQLLWEGVSDSKGMIETEAELIDRRANEIKIWLSDPNGYYADKEVFLFKGKHSFISSEINLSPSEATFANWLAVEDSIYGDRNSGTFAKESNNDTTHFGCSKTEFKEPIFPGGQDAMNHYNVTNLRFPQESIEMNEQGRVQLTFVIEADGKITHIRIEHGASPTLNTEAWRLIHSMPLWQPATCNGETTRSLASITVAFNLE